MEVARLFTTALGFSEFRHYFPFNIRWSSLLSCLLSIKKVEITKRSTDGNPHDRFGGVADGVLHDDAAVAVAMRPLLEPAVYLLRHLPRCGEPFLLAHRNANRRHCPCAQVSINLYLYYL